MPLAGRRNVVRAVVRSGNCGYNKKSGDGAAIATTDDTSAPGGGLSVTCMTYMWYGADGLWATTGETTFGGTVDPAATSAAFFR
jgi:hypothetical protein